MKKDKKNIEFVVLNCFIRTIKTDGKYMLYRRGVKNTGIMKYLTRGNTYSDSPFSSAESTSDVCKTLERITNDMVKNNGNKSGIKGLDKYEHVTMTINHLLHFFLETAGISMEKLCSMGEEIYNLSCNKLFGDTIDELDEKNDIEMNNINDLGQLKAKMFQDYVHDINSGKINPTNVSFESYLKSRKKEIDDFRKQRNIATEQQGHVLGRAPEDVVNYRDMTRVTPEWFDDDFDGHHF